jgi:hypothetical protein
VIVIKLWREDKRWTWVVQDISADRRKVSVVARAKEETFLEASSRALAVHEAAEAGQDAARALLGAGSTASAIMRGRK